MTGGCIFHNQVQFSEPEETVKAGDGGLNHYYGNITRGISCESFTSGTSKKKMAQTNNFKKIRYVYPPGS